MKKLIFGIAALFMMSVVLVSCGDKKSTDKNKDEKENTEKAANLSPEEKMMGYLEDMVDLLKDTKITDADDVKEFANEAKIIKEKIEKLQAEVSDDYESQLSEVEEKEFTEKLSTLMQEMMKEAERVQKEAVENGVDMSELQGINF